ncbi:MAG: hypothetical protein FWE45_03365 [Firmicutes bacterium]|nr:hypothetical protein [Bacillota bacterium]
MTKLNFETLHSEKVALTMDIISTLTEIKESDTTVPKGFYNRMCSHIIRDYVLKMKLFNKNLKFVGRETRKDHRVFRKLQKKTRASERKIAIAELQENTNMQSATIQPPAR